MPAHLLPDPVVSPLDMAWFTAAATVLGRHLQIDPLALAHDAATHYAQWLRRTDDWTPVHDDTGTLIAWLDDDGVRPVTADELRARALDDAADRWGAAIDSYARR